MTGLLFSLRNGFKQLLARATINVLIVFCFLVGNTLFFIACTYGEAIFSDLGSARLHHMERTAIVSISNTSFLSAQQGVLPDALRAFLSEQPALEAYSVMSRAQIENDAGKTPLVYFVDLRFADFYHFYVVEGRFFTQEEIDRKQPVCIVEANHKTERVGDSIVLSGQRFQIIGKIKTANFLGRTFLPATLVDRFLPDLIGYDVAIRGENLAQLADIPWDTLPNTLYEIRPATEYYQSVVGRMTGLIALVFAVGVAMMLYALLNAYNIIANKMMEESQSYAIRHLLGANEKHLFAQFFFEVLLLMALANGAVMLADPLLDTMVRGTLNHYFGPITFFLMVAQTLLVSFALSRLVFRAFKRHSTVALARGEML